MKLSNLTGLRYGKLVVQERVPLTKRTKWLCLCDCGRTTPVYAFNLTTGNTTTCGCSGKGRLSKTDLTGKRFGQLTVTSQAAVKGCTSWHCVCDCGQLTIKAGGALRAGDVKTCGCGSHPMRYSDPSMSAFNELFRQYQKNAIKLGRTFTLPVDRFRELVTQACHYCGQPPTQQGTHGRSLRRTQVTRQEPFLYNGLDRIDNGQGYEEGNVIPCCKRCNWMKSDLSQSAFLDHLRCIVKHLG
jgi:hypothetical protein